MPSASPRPIFHACIANAVQESRLLISTLVEAARTALAEEETNSRDLTQRALIGEALRKLELHAEDLIKGYPRALRHIVSQAALPSNQPRNTPGGLAELSLVAEDDIMAEVEMSRAQQLASQFAEAPLSELDTLISAAQGLGSVQPKSNPLRPENYIRALQHVVSSTGVSGQVRQFWMRYMRDRLGTMLAEVYQHTAEHLRQQGVVPVGYVVVAPAGKGQHAAQATAPASAAHSTWNHDSAAAFNHGIRNGVGMAAGIPTMEAIAGTVPTVAVGVMEDIDHIDQLVTRLPATHLGTLEGNIQIVPFAPTAPAPAPAQSLAPQAVLRQMMENIAQNTHLLPAVRQAVLRLEPALAQLVLHDGQFFADAQHPARQLLDELTQRSLAFPSEAAPGFDRFMRLVAEVLDYLAVVEIQNAAPFEQVLNALKKVWDKPQPQTTAPAAAPTPTPTPEPEPAAAPPNPDERRKQLTQHFAAEFAAYPETADLPEDWRTFLIGAWAKVAAQAYDTQPAGNTAADPGGYRALVPLLLRCTQSEALRSDPHGMNTALAEAIPIVQQGLESIACPPQYLAYALKRLAQWQQQAQEYAAMLAQEKKETEETPWEASLEPDASGSSPTSGQIHSTHLSSEHAGNSRAISPSRIPDNPIPKLGQWVDITKNQHIVRAQLTWHSPNQMIFMFTNEDGSTLSMTRRMIDRLAAEGMFTPLPPA